MRKATVKAQIELLATALIIDLTTLPSAASKVQETEARLLEYTEWLLAQARTDAVLACTLTSH